MILTDEEWCVLSEGMLLDIERKNICVNANNQTYDCCDCTICRQEFLRRVRNDLEGIEPFRPLS